MKIEKKEFGYSLCIDVYKLDKKLTPLPFKKKKGDKMKYKIERTLGILFNRYLFSKLVVGEFSFVTIRYKQVHNNVWFLVIFLFLFYMTVKDLNLNKLFIRDIH